MLKLLHRIDTKIFSSQTSKVKDFGHLLEGLHRAADQRQSGSTHVGFQGSPAGCGALLEPGRCGWGAARPGALERSPPCCRSDWNSCEQRSGALRLQETRKDLQFPPKMRRWASQHQRWAAALQNHQTWSAFIISLLWMTAVCVHSYVLVHVYV